MSFGINYQANSFSVTIALLIWEEYSQYRRIGVIQGTIESNSVSLKIPEINLAHSEHDLTFYPLALPLLFTTTIHENTNSVTISLTQFPTAITTLYLSYIYLTNIVPNNGVFAVFTEISQDHSSLNAQYHTFSYTPGEGSLFFAIQQYNSSGNNFLGMSTYHLSTSDANASYLEMGCLFDHSKPTQLTLYAVLFNSSFSSCQSQQFLSYPSLYHTLPSTCLACSVNCLSCAPASSAQPQNSTSSHCLSCSYLRYLNSSTSPIGECLCYPGLEEVDG